MTTRRSFLKRAARAICGVIAAVYIPEGPDLTERPKELLGRPIEWVSTMREYQDVSMKKLADAMEKSFWGVQQHKPHGLDFWVSK